MLTTQAQLEAARPSDAEGADTAGAAMLFCCVPRSHGLSFFVFRLLCLSVALSLIVALSCCISLARSDFLSLVF